MDYNKGLGHKELKNGYITLTQMDMSPAVLRVDRIKSRTEYKDYCKVVYGNDNRVYKVRETYMEIGNKINEVTI